MDHRKIEKGLSSHWEAKKLEMVPYIGCNQMKKIEGKMTPNTHY